MPTTIDRLEHHRQKSTLSKLFTTQLLTPQLLIDKIPTHTKAENTLVERVVGREEIVFLAHRLVDVAHHHEKARVFQMEIRVSIHDGSISRFHAIVVARGSQFLLGELTDGRAVVGRVIRREKAGVGTEIDAQHASNFES